jgi:hypothetical protein
VEKNVLRGSHVSDIVIQVVIQKSEEGGICASM